MPGPIDFVTPVEEYGLPTGPTRVISRASRPFISNRVMSVGIVGDRNNVVTVSADVPNAVTIEDAGVGGAGIHWFRLSNPRGGKITIQAKDARGTVVTSFELNVIELPRASGPKDFTVGPADPNSPNTINLVAYAPKDDADYIDNRMTAIGYSVYYLGGFVVYCDGMSIPIHVPRSLVDLKQTKAEPIDAKVYDTLAQANEAIRLAPAKAQGVTPFAYYRGAGGAVIAPTIFSVVTTPRTIATFFLARVALKDYVQRELTGIAIGIVAGMVLRAVVGWIFRAPKNLKPPPRGAPPLPEPPALTRLRNTVDDKQSKNPLRTAEVLSSPRVYRHNLTSNAPPMSYAHIEKEGSLELATGADAHYGEGVYAWPAGKPSTRAYIDIEVPPGTAVETLNVGGQRWVRMVPPNGDRLPVKIVGTNLSPAQIKMAREFVAGAPDDI
jgi:hypothetical protein